MRRRESALNCLLAVDKPCGMTSHDVVARVRRAVGERRVGHAGTLDPAASGVLVVGVGQGTRLMGLLTAERKSYVGLVVLGAQTDTDDAEGAVVCERDVPAWATDAHRVREFVAALEGEHMQVPPSFSAISVDGVRSYARARAGERFELPARPVTVYEARLLSVQAEEDGRVAWLCSFVVSKGCYVRAIARDLGLAAGSAAHLGALRRTSSGSVSVGSCVSLEALAEAGASGAASLALDPARALGLPVRRLADDELADVSCGRRIALGRVELPYGGTEAQAAASAHGSSESGGSGSAEPAVAPAKVSLVRDGELLGVWERHGDDLVCSVNFPHGILGVRA